MNEPDKKVYLGSILYINVWIDWPRRSPELVSAAQPDTHLLSIGIETEFEYQKFFFTFTD